MKATTAWGNANSRTQRCHRQPASGYAVSHRAVNSAAWAPTRPPQDPAPARCRECHLNPLTARRPGRIRPSCDSGAPDEEVDMTMSERAVRAKSSVDRVTEFFSRIQAVAQDADALDFTFGNPHEMRARRLTDAMRAQLEPRSVDWYAYKTSERPAQEAVAAGLRGELGPRLRARRHRDDAGRVRRDRARARAWSPTRATRSSSRCPGWFCYEPMLHRGRPGARVRRRWTRGLLDLDVDAIARAITPRTRVVIVNSPSNPTGRVFSRDAGTSSRPSSRSLPHARTPHLAPLRRAVPAHPLRRHRLRQPGRRLPVDDDRLQLRQGPPRPRSAARLPRAVAAAPDRRARRAARRRSCRSSSRSAGASRMRSCSTACRRSRRVSIDIDELTRKRDRLYGALTDAGYALTRPEGTFYLWGGRPAAMRRRTAMRWRRRAST